jgi:hypothetical protein
VSNAADARRPRGSRGSGGGARAGCALQRRGAPTPRSRAPPHPAARAPAPDAPALARGHFFRDLIRFDTDTHAWETVYEDLPFVAVSHYGGDATVTRDCGAPRRGGRPALDGHHL